MYNQFLVVSLCKNWFFAALLVIVLSCSEEEFSCTSGSCVSAQLICDFKEDCEDGSDEEYCGMLTFNMVILYKDDWSNTELNTSKTHAFNTLDWET